MIQITPGQCTVCGCTDRRGCRCGCWWVDAERTLCSRCAHNVSVMVLALRRMGRRACQSIN